MRLYEKIMKESIKSGKIPESAVKAAHSSVKDLCFKFKRFSSDDLASHEMLAMSFLRGMAYEQGKKRGGIKQCQTRNPPPSQTSTALPQSKKYSKG